jgi:predicted Zn-dependent protease
MKLSLKPENCLIAGLFLSLLLFSGCATVPETGRSALRLMPEAQLESMASASFAQMRQELPVSNNPEYIRRVRDVGYRIAHAVRNELPNTQWDFVVFDDDSINAFAMPGGYVGVHAGMFKIAETDDELAVVMGHEVAHVVAKHGNERVSQQLLISGAGLALMLGTHKMDRVDRDLIMAAFGAGSTIGFLLPYSRHHEAEADELGLFYMARAGYDPRAAISFWQKMSAESRGGVPEFLSTHPSGTTRIRLLESLMPRAVAEYERTIRVR